MEIDGPLPEGFMPALAELFQKALPALKKGGEDAPDQGQG